MIKERQEPDPFREIREAQDHRLDPGHFAGGRFHPMFASRRPNRMGWVLIIIGGLTALTFPWVLFSETPIVGIITIGAMAALLLGAGIRLVRGPRKQHAA
jgi:hypothetical protein